jgi:hypothetical protein
MLRRRLRSLTALLAFPLVAVISCGGDSPFGPEADLTAEEVEDVFTAIYEANEILLGGFAMAGAREAALMADLTESISESAPCPEGGTTSISGSVTSTETGGSVDVRQDYADCAVYSESLRLWVFNGRPNVRTKMTMNYNEISEVFTLNGTITGGFSFTSGDDAGNCSVNLTITLTETIDSFTGSISGTVCGQPVSESLTA